MTAAGDQSLAVAYAQVGATENPPYSNLCSPYTDAWGAGAWCAMFVSWCYTAAGYPLPAIDGPAGFSYVPNGQVAAYTTGHSVGDGGVEPGDTLIFSWEAWHMEGGIALCSYGAYAGTPAGDHTGFFAGWLGGGYMATVEGNTSASSWDNGGAVLARNDRYTGQICCYARHAALGAGGGGGGGTGEDDFMAGLPVEEQYNMANRVKAMYDQQNYRDFDALGLLRDIFNQVGAMFGQQNGRDFDALALLRDIFNMVSWTNTRTSRAEADEYGTPSGGAVNFFAEVRHLLTPRLTSAQISAIADELPRNVSAADVEQATTKVLGAEPAEPEPVPPPPQ